MPDAQDRLTQIRSQLDGRQPHGKPVREGNALRQRLDSDDGETMLLYVFDDPTEAERVIRSRQEDLGSQLFIVPVPIETGDDWLLIEHPGGEPLREGTPSGRDLSCFDGVRGHALLRDVGTVMRKVHSCTGSDVFGEVVERERGEDDRQLRWLTFSGFVAAQLEEFSEHLREHDFSEGERSELATSIADLRHELSAFHPRNPAGLIHGRFSLEHIWVEEEAREVVALTGFERAAFLPAEADIAYFLWIEGIGRVESLTRAFYQGYGAARTMDVQRRERFYRRLVALEALFGLKGDVPMPRDELIELATSVTI